MADPGRLWAARRDMGMLALCLLPWLIIEAVHRDWGPFPWQGDYAQYLLHAKAIVEGRAYDDIGYLYHPDAWPIGPRAYPPGLPLMLAPLVAVGGVSSVAIKYWQLFAVALACLLAFLALRRHADTTVAALGAGFTAVALEAVSGTRIPLSDPAFAACLWGAILVVPDDGRWSWRHVTAMTVLLAGAVALRQAGLALVLALSMHSVVSWRRHRGRALVPIVVLGAIGALVLAQGKAGGSGVGQLLTPLGSIAKWARYIATEYRLSAFEATLYPFGGNLIDDVYHGIGVIAMTVGAGVLLWRTRHQLLPWVLLSYVVMLVGVRVAEPRYVWPFYPLGAVALGTGLQYAGSLLRWPASWVRHGVVTLLGSVLVLAAARSVLRAPLVFTYASPDAAALMELLRGDTFAHARLVAPNPRVFTLLTGRPAMGPLGRTGPGQLAAWRDMRITHVVWQRDDLSTCLQRVVNRVPQEFPSVLRQLWENPTFRLYEVGPIPSVDRSYERIDPGAPEPWCAAHLPLPGAPAR